jgi:hypothetical protein
MPDISPAFRYNPTDSRLMEELLRHEATPLAIVRFSEVCDQLTDYAYWFLLSSLWVSFSGWSDLGLWKRLFKSRRPNREISLMKPSELKVWRALPNWLTIYRAHRTEETDWIAYTIDPVTAAKFARQRNVDSITEYRVRKRDALALFLRRGEQEVLVLDKSLVQRVREIEVIIEGTERHKVLIEEAGEKVTG